MILVAKLFSICSKSCIKNSERCSLFLIVLCSALALTACQPSAPVRQQAVLTGPIMGTEYRITVVSDTNIDEQKVGDSVLDAMQSINQSMSNYIVDSELSKFNRLAANAPLVISPDFAAVIIESQKISKLSSGAVDVTLAKAIDAWGVGPDGTISKKPSDNELLILRDTVGYQYLSLQGLSLSKSKDGVEVSLSAIAKGYAVDKVASVIEAHGISDYLVNIGGELRASGKSIDAQVWRVGIEKPHILGGIQQIALLDNKAIATSGDYRNYFVVDGEQFSHTIDPLTLKPVLHKLALVSIITDKATTADALATAMMVMGEEKAWSFAVKNNIAAYFIVRGDGKEPFVIKYTEEFKRNLQ
jgi:thiamine biosynthesis lipoprotein